MAWSKPPAGASPNQSHPHAQGLKHAFLFNERFGRQTRDCVGGLKATFNGSPVWSSRLHGGSIAFDGSSDLSLVAGTDVFGPVVIGPYTIIAGLMQTGSQAGFQTVWTNGAVGLYINGGAVQLFSSTTSIRHLVVNAPTVVSVSANHNDPINFAEGELDYVINGVFDTTNNNSITLPEMSGATIGGHGSERFIGEISFLYIYDRFISSRAGGLMQQIHADPFAMFAPSYASLLNPAVAAQLAGSLTGTGTITGSLATGVALAGAVSGAGTATANLTVPVLFVGALSGTGTATAQVTTDIALVGNISVAGNTHGSLGGNAFSAALLAM